MDAEARSAAAPVAEQLFTEGERFAYFQAVRLLRRYARANGLAPDALRVRPKLGLGFPETDIDCIERLQAVPVAEAADDWLDPEQTPSPQAVQDLQDAAHALAHDPAPISDIPEVLRLTANFFGLYGVASPLPSFYTEDLLDEQREGRHGMRAFLDILHCTIYPLLFDGWLKYRPQVRIVEEGDARMLDHLYAFVGLHDQALRPREQPGVDDLLRYAGLFAQRPHSALGLRTMLTDAFAPAQVAIYSCAHGWLAIPQDQRTALGDERHALGIECYLGTLIDDRENHLRIELGQLPPELFHALLPGQAMHERLRFLVRFYLLDPLEVIAAIGLPAGHARPARAGGSTWNRLGLNTWLAPDAQHVPEPVKFRI